MRAGDRHFRCGRGVREVGGWMGGGAGGTTKKLPLSEIVGQTETVEHQCGESAWGRRCGTWEFCFVLFCFALFCCFGSSYAKNIFFHIGFFSFYKRLNAYSMDGG